MGKYTEEELAGLTEAEREGLLDPDLMDDEPDDADAQAAIEGKAEPEDDAEQETGEGEGEDTPETPAKPEPEPAATKEEPATPKAVKAEEPESAEEPEPKAKPAEPEPDADTNRFLNNIPKWDMPENYEARTAALEEKLVQLEIDAEDGKITQEEKVHAIREVNADIKELDRQALKAEMAREMSFSAQYSRWSYEVVPSFLALPECQHYQPGSDAMKWLEDEVCNLQLESGVPFDPNHLVRAHEIVEAKFDRIYADRNAAREKTQKPETAAESSPKTPAPTEQRPVPPKLSDLPASDMTPVDDGSEFAAIERLTGVELENWMEKTQQNDPAKFARFMER